MVGPPYDDVTAVFPADTFLLTSEHYSPLLEMRTVEVAWPVLLCLGRQTMQAFTDLMKQ